MKFNEEGPKNDNGNTWISHDKGGSIQVSFPKKMAIISFVLKTSNYPTRGAIGSRSWQGGPNFDLRNSYANVQFLADGVLVGKTASDLRVEKARQSLDMMKMLSNPDNSVEGFV